MNFYRLLFGKIISHQKDRGATCKDFSALVVDCVVDKKKVNRCYSTKCFVEIANPRKESRLSLLAGILFLIVVVVIMGVVGVVTYPTAGAVAVFNGAGIRIVGGAVPIIFTAMARWWAAGRTGRRTRWRAWRWTGWWARGGTAG